MAAAIYTSSHEQLKLKWFEDDWPANLEEAKEIWLVGGDGTVNYFLNQYPGIQIPMMIFPGGTGNDIHWKIYGDLSWSEQLSKREKFTIRSVDLGLCNNSLFVNGVGIGFDGEVLKSMKAIRSIGGHLGYLLVVIQKIFSFREPEYQITVNSQTFRKKCMLLSVANSSRTGGGFMVSPLADIFDGLLNFFYCEPLPIWRRLLALPKVEKGTHLSLPFIHHETLKEILIQTDDTVFAQIDGELIQSNQFKIRMSEHQLNVRC